MPKDYVTAATVEQLLQDEGSLAYIEYCYGIGDEQAAKDYLYLYTEAANQAPGEKIADLVSFNDAGGGALEVIHTVVEFMAQFGYGATGNFIQGVKRIFTDEDDSIEAYKTNNNQQQRLKLAKSLPNADYLTIDIVSGSKRTIDVVTVYITKKK